MNLAKGLSDEVRATIDSYAGSVVKMKVKTVLVVSGLLRYEYNIDYKLFSVTNTGNAIIWHFIFFTYVYVC